MFAAPAFDHYVEIVWRLEVIIHGLECSEQLARDAIDVDVRKIRAVLFRVGAGQLRDLLMESRVLLAEHADRALDHLGVDSRQLSEFGVVSGYDILFFLYSFH